MRCERIGGLECLPLSASLHTLSKPLVAFDAKAQAWEHYTNTPLGRLRQELTLRHLVQHLDAFSGCLEVLDAGGGTGAYAFFMARLGHNVYLLDFSAQMLDVARTKIESFAPCLVERIKLCHATVEDIPHLFDPQCFDLIMCHTLLEYVSAPWETLLTLVTALRPGGLLSLLCTNPRADPLCWALAKGDLEKARLSLAPHASPADLFGLPRRTFTAEEITDAVARAGMEAMAGYGIRIFADYVPLDTLSNPESYTQLLALELEAGSVLPYRLIARYSQILARKPGIA